MVHICTGFPDWRGRGVRGVRPVMLRFFLTVQVSGVGSLCECIYIYIYYNRSVCLCCFNYYFYSTCSHPLPHTQRLAEERLSLAELEQPGARRLDEKIRPEANLGRWKLLWNGHDVVQKVLHW